jgi:prenyltransferase beta subunit
MNHTLKQHVARLLVCCVSLLVFCSGAAAQEDDPEKTASKMVTPAADEAIEKGLLWLADNQHDNGSFGSAAYRDNVAVTALAAMAMLSGGSTPGRGPYGHEVDRCVDYLLACSQQSGFISAPASASHGPMYGHGFATLALAETYGMSKRPEMREKLSKAVKLIVNTQNKDGGWRYYPQRADADISVTICQMMALRAARNAGMVVPGETIDRCIDYVKRSQNADGGFAYMLSGGESMFPRSAAGVVTLYSAGVYEGPEIDKGIEYLMKFMPEKGVTRRETYYYYGQYYAVQAMWQAGGDKWSRWYPAVRDQLIERQLEDGLWTSPQVCREYATAMACIVLQMPNNYLPIFQR